MATPDDRDLMLRLLNVGPSVSPGQQRALVPQATQEAVISEATTVLLEPNWKEAVGRYFPAQFFTHQWTRSDNYGTALNCLQAIAAALPAPQRNIVPVLVGAALDVYHKDRADAACTLLQSGVMPTKTIPPSFVEGGRSYVSQTYEMEAWRDDIPIWAITPVARVSQRALPDTFYFVRYIREVVVIKSLPPAPPIPYPDPIIYAQYGPWYVEVARWE